MPRRPSEPQVTGSNPLGCATRSMGLSWLSSLHSGREEIFVWHRSLGAGHPAKCRGRLGVDGPDGGAEPGGDLVRAEEAAKRTGNRGEAIQLGRQSAVFLPTLEPGLEAVSCCILL
jgi:hypothetical protein